MLVASGIDVYEGNKATAANLIATFRPDVLSMHGAPDWIINIGQSIGVPSVDNLHGMHTLFGADWHAEAARSKKLAAIVAVSELVRQQYLAGNSQFAPDRIVVIPNGVDDERRPLHERGTSRKRLGLTDEYLFVSLARYCMQKNQYGLLDAFGEVARHHSDAHLVIAGRPDDVRYYRRVLRRQESLPCSDRIHLRDHVASPAELLAAADGFVLDSYFEGWSLASMEALCAGVPVVLSDVGGAREQVGESPCRGYVVGNPLGDPLAVDWESVGDACYRRQVNKEDLVTAMRGLVRNRKDYLHNRGALASESAERFSPNVCLASHAALLRAAAADESLPSHR
jgi:glycosyltransferase involved in cell wall biosynthesis